MLLIKAIVKIIIHIAFKKKSLSNVNSVKLGDILIAKVDFVMECTRPIRSLLEFRCHLKL